MSFELPTEQTKITRRAAPALETQRQQQENLQQHQALVAELKSLAKKQSDRIEKLKRDTAVHLEHHSTLRRLELERKKSTALEQMSDLTPRLEVVRSQWNHAKHQNQGYEMQWGSMRAQFQQVKQRVDTLKDQIADGRGTVEGLRKTLTDMREHLHKLERDKAALRSKMQRALECVVMDDNFLTVRVAEEEMYRTQVANALQAMEADYQESQMTHQHEFAPLEEDCRVLSNYLEEMQQRTRELHKYGLELEGKAATIEDQWLESVHSVFEGLERANHLDQLKNVVLSMLEQQITAHQQDGIAPRNKAGHLDGLWLSNAVLVWELIVREVSQERQKMQIRDDSSQLLAETSQRAQQAKTMLQSVKSKVEGQGPQRRQLLQDILELHFLLQEKKESEDSMISFLQEEATQLDEDLSKVLHLVRKDGFDDYVSSTEHEGDSDGEDDGLAPMREETKDDISMLVSSMDLDPADPATMETIKRMSHRPDGPLRDFSRQRQAYLQRTGHSKHQNLAIANRKPITKETLERALMETQVKVANMVINHVKKRAAEIAAGTLDPKQDRLQADDKYIARAKDISARIDKWVQEQKDDPQAKKGWKWPSEKGGTKTEANQPGRIVLEGIRVPPEVARANSIAKAAYYATNCVRGFKVMMYMRRSMAPQLRQVFLSRDLSRIVARAVSNDTDEEFVLRLVDINNILLGHKTEVFRDVRAFARVPLKEEVAFSIVTGVGSTFDFECDNVEDRNYWAGNFAWVINEMRQGGILSTLQRNNKVNVVDTMARTANTVEIRDRQVLQVQIMA